MPTATTTADNLPVHQDVPDMTEALGSELDCVAKLRPLWLACDVHPHFPTTTATAVELLRVGAGLDVTLGLLEGWIRSGMIPDVKMRSGRFAWSAANIVVAATQADCWRRWIFNDQRHLHKLTSIELAEGLAQAAGSTAFSDIGTFDVNAFVEILVRCDDAEMRRTFGVALKTKLRLAGALDK